MIIGRGYVPYGKETGSKVGDADIVRLEHEIKARFLKKQELNNVYFSILTAG